MVAAHGSAIKPMTIFSRNKNSNELNYLNFRATFSSFKRLI